jgi:hypothetical protein
VSADRSTTDGWLRKLEDAANEHSDDPTWRAWAFRSVIAEAWQDGHGRGYDDCRDDHDRARAAERRAAREAAKETP